MKMSKIIEVIKELHKLARVGKIPLEDISNAEHQLCLNFAEEYKEYLAEFGAISAKGIELTGIIAVEYCNVVSITKQEWELNPKVPHTMYVIENTCIDGIVVWQDADGLIYRTGPNSEPKQIASSLADYVLIRTKK